MKTNSFLLRNGCSTCLINGHSADYHIFYEPLYWKSNLIELTIRVPIKENEHCELRFNRKNNKILFCHEILCGSKYCINYNINIILQSGQTISDIIRLINNNITIGKCDGYRFKIDDDDLPF